MACIGPMIPRFNEALVRMTVWVLGVVLLEGTLALLGRAVPSLRVSVTALFVLAPFVLGAIIFDPIVEGMLKEAEREIQE